MLEVAVLLGIIAGILNRAFVYGRIPVVSPYIFLTNFPDKWTVSVPQWMEACTLYTAVASFFQCDKTRPHPFHDDAQKDDGTWELGEPSWFDIVEDDQFDVPRDDRGLKTHREQIVAWLYAPTPLTETGMREALPVKAFEDTNDSTRMITAEWGRQQRH